MDKYTSCKILINHPGGIGDFLMATPVLRAIHEQLPKSIISIIVSSSAETVAKKYPYFHSIYTHPLIGKPGWHRLLGHFRLLFLVRREAPDILIHFVSSPAGRSIWLINKICGVQKTIGFHRDNCRPINKISFEVDETIHDIVQNLKILDALGLKSSGSYMEYPITKKAELGAEQFLKENGIKPNDIKVAIQPVTKGMMGENSRLWPLDRFAAVARVLSDRYGAKIIIMGNKSECGPAETMASLVGPSALIQSGKTSFEVAAALLKLCDLFICNDSGLMHLADTLDIPMVAIWGPPDPIRRGYQDEKRIVIKKPMVCSPCLGISERYPCKKRKCLFDISVEDVASAASTLLDRI